MDDVLVDAVSVLVGVCYDVLADDVCWLMMDDVLADG